MSSLAVNEREQDFVPVANIKALNYRNDRIIARLAEEGGFEMEEARELFADTLKFLALTDNGIKLSPAARIDLGWHVFLLHTRDYAGFCHSCFGHFIHHDPGSGLMCSGPKMDVVETAHLAQSVFGEISGNWTATRGATCGSGGC